MLEKKLNNLEKGGWRKKKGKIIGILEAAVSSETWLLQVEDLEGKKHLKWINYLDLVPRFFQ